MNLRPQPSEDHAAIARAAQRTATEGDDRHIAQQVAGGDVRAFERLLRRFNGPLYRVARAIVKDDAEAEDVLQDAMLRAYRAMGTFRGDARLSTWLTRIVANEAFGRLRARARGADVVALFGDGADLDAIEAAALDADAGVARAAAPADPERNAPHAELRRLIEARIDALPDAFRVVFVLRALQELSVEETATVLAIEPATVRTRFFRARALLRESLAQDLDRATDAAYVFGGAHCDRVTAFVLAHLGATPAPR